MADSNKTEQATPRQRKRARERGQGTRSRELNGALSLAAVAGVIWFMSSRAVPDWPLFFRNALASASTDNIQPNGPLLFWTSVEAMRWVFPILAVAMVAALGTGFAQGGFVFAPEALSPKAERMSPAGKLKQMVSLTALSGILKSLVPFAVIGWIGYGCIRSHWGQILGSSYTDSRRFASFMSSLVLEIGWKCGLVLLGWAAVDYLLLWRKSEGD